LLKAILVAEDNPQKYAKFVQTVADRHGYQRQQYHRRKDGIFQIVSNFIAYDHKKLPLPIAVL
jgi:hypothetical protein